MSNLPSPEITMDNSKNLSSNQHRHVVLIMSLSHGNANVERGFSVNSECLVENLKEETLVAQRLVYDSFVSTVGDENIEKREQLENDAVEVQKKKAKLIKRELEQKMSKIKENANKEINSIM